MRRPQAVERAIVRISTPFLYSYANLFIHADTGRSIGNKRMNMKHIFVPVLLNVVLFVQCGMPPFFSKSSTILPQKILKTIATLDSVVAYQINAMDAVADTSESLCGFALNGKSFPIKKEQVDTLKVLIDSIVNRNLHERVYKLSTFIPDYGFKFCLPKDSIVLLGDLHADLWMFYYKNKQYQMNSDSVRNEMNLLLNAIFKKSQTADMQELNDTQTNGYEIASETVSTNDVSEKSEDDKDEKTEYVKLSDDICQIVDTAQEIMCYIIDPLSPDDKDMEKFGKYTVLQKSLVKDTVLTRQFKNLITDDKRFEKFEVVKNCTFLPDIVFQIQNEEKSLHILFSFYCNECEIKMGGKRVFRNDCSLIQPQIIDFSKRIFPKDKYLRTIK